MSGAINANIRKFFFALMPATFYQRYERYLHHPDAVRISRKKRKRVHEGLRRLFDKRQEPGFVPTYIDQPENGTVYRVRLYPDSYIPTIDRFIWLMRCELVDAAERAAAADIAQPEVLKQPTRERKRIPAKPKPIFSLKNNK